MICTHFKTLCNLIILASKYIRLRFYVDQVIIFALEAGHKFVRGFPYVPQSVHNGPFAELATSLISIVILCRNIPICQVISMSFATLEPQKMFLVSDHHFPAFLL